MTTALARKPISTTLTSGLKRQVVETTAKVIQGAFPQVTVAQQASRKYFAIFVTSISVAGFMALLGINTLLAQDAFTLSNLKIEAKLVADQRDAINRKIDSHAAPDALANAAIALGMKQSDTPIFLNLSASGEVTHG
jgi:hypothetical protein